MYTFLTQYNSPNYTPASEAQATWGRPRVTRAVDGAKIAIHWWGDPNTNPSFEGVISTLCNPAREASAHFVATGTQRRVACLVDPADASWATNSANPYTFSIECDPRCRPEDYDVVAEVVADLWATYGVMPLVPHKQFTATACPGNYDLAKIEAIAKTKIADPNAQYGASVKDKDPVAPPPVVTPPPVTPPPVINPPTPTPLPTEPDKLDRIGAKVEENNQRLKAIKALLEGLIATINRIFK
jgi:hypothetical protein